MPFQIPENLHPDCGPVVWLLGTWHGNGRGDYPTIDAYEYKQEVVFQQDGRPFFHYFARSWVIDENGETIRQGAQETGFLRCLPEGKLELVLAHNTGISEVWYGVAGAGKVELRTAGVSFTETAKEVVGGHRLYGNVEGDLLYAYDMEAEGHPLQPHLWARLQRA
ncbi:FABP family protein [Nocardioides sp. 1609]|uniref:FABP family protein n=1 Tax=Nocardioides sp. 1609 TaxID=2508327 RepID=UPI00106F93A4|nr:FABP family protein [Nocardioides sp. 1609]